MGGNGQGQGFSVCREVNIVRWETKLGVHPSSPEVEPGLDGVMAAPKELMRSRCEEEEPANS